MSPGEAQLAQRELVLADESLGDAAILLASGARRGATSRLYYAVFHAARAALIVHGKHAKTHSGQITLFETTFGEEAILGRLFDLRSRADYGDEAFVATAEQLRLQQAEAKAFVEACGRIVREAVAAGPDEPDPPPDL